VSRNDVILTVFAAILVLFSLAVSLWVPRRDPGFPGRSLRVFALIAVLLVAAMLAAVEVFGESHQFGEAEGGEEPSTTQPTETGGGGGEGAGEGEGEGEGEGDPAAGEQVFAAQQCGTCHTLQAAGATATLGPNLDETLQGKDAAYIRESILNPSAQIAKGFQDGLMPKDYGEKLSEEELANLVAFLEQATQGS
jgi:mono/diheme cytochrome c family protein